MEEILQPHCVLMQEDTLDHILSFLRQNLTSMDDEDERTSLLLPARLVCQKWNERILTNFHKKLSFALVNDDRTVWDQPSILTSCDPRILSSVSMCRTLPQEPNPAEWMLEATLEHLRLSEGIRGLRVLRDLEIDERTLDYLIRVTNQGEFKGLEQLSFSVRFNEGRWPYKSMIQACSKAFPGLKVLNVTLEINSQEIARYHKELLPATLQSLATAAPNLHSFTSNVLLDLPGTKLRRLDVSYCDIGDEEKALKLLDTVKWSLTHLSLGSYFPAIQLQVLPKLHSLEFHGHTRYNVNVTMNLSEINFKAFPSLVRMTIHSTSISGEQLSSILPPIGKLRMLKLESITWPDAKNLTAWVEPFRILMKSGLSSLILHFEQGQLRISQLREILQLVDMVETVDKKCSGTLEFHCVEDDVKGCSLWDFGFFLAKLGRHWSRVEFNGFKFQIKPSKEEIRAVLFGGTKHGKIKINRSSGTENVTVVLEITNCKNQA